jgi:lipopolysaccharide transport system ATP-binding protein
MSSERVGITTQGHGSPVIEAVGLGKSYELFARPADRLKSLLWSRATSGRRHWAVRDVSFRVDAGEVLGIVGRNGAGKSTLLQMVCGTLRPSEGELKVRGRIAALLELGAGFNPDFTGIENVYLNAALLGLTRAQVDARLDEILAFADIGDFVHQPVKTYSSGMFVRLAFAVATSVDPQLLVIDEALSVGDGAFARKSFERVMQLRDNGASILLCSHSVYHVQALCNRALWLDRGQVRGYGPAASVTASYETALVADMARAVPQPAPSADPTSQAELPPVPAGTGAPARIRGIDSWTDDGQRGTELAVASGQTTVNVQVRFASDPSLPAPTLAFGIGHLSGITVSSGLSLRTGIPFTRDPSGAGTALLRLPHLPLLRGDYHLSLALACERGLHVYELVEHAVTLRVSQQGPEQGLFTVGHDWQDVPTPPPNR